MRSIRSRPTGRRLSSARTFGSNGSITARRSRHGRTYSISTSNKPRRVALLYGSNPLSAYVANVNCSGIAYSPSESAPFDSESKLKIP